MDWVDSRDCAAAKRRKIRKTGHDLFVPVKEKVFDFCEALPRRLFWRWSLCGLLGE